PGLFEGLSHARRGLAGPDYHRASLGARRQVMPYCTVRLGNGNGMGEKVGEKGTVHGLGKLSGAGRSGGILPGSSRRVQHLGLVSSWYMLPLNRGRPSRVEPRARTYRREPARYRGAVETIWSSIDGNGEQQ